MASLIRGFEYDIFISYRQKDNKGDRWVSEFVDALKTELESTFKEEITLYFDVNPHNGLLETHDVDASLREKLRCLVFIPIISRTYCDPRSFAWEQEFKAFIEQASNDQFGLKVKLPYGNVAGRILPVQIHDLNPEDKTLLEKELGGALRAIEFIYKEPGVNRPLTPEDDESKNLNGTKYRNQINKVANAIDELIVSLKGVRPTPAKENSNYKELPEESDRTKEKSRMTGPRQPGKTLKPKQLTGAIVFGILLLIAAIIAYPKLFKKNPLRKFQSSGERISVAVMPFKNMTNDSTLNIWQDGIQFNLIASLSNTQALKVMQTESTNNLLKSKGLTNYALITPTVAKNISQNLDADVFVYGSLNQAGGKIRISAQLIDSKTLEIFRSFQLDGVFSRILAITDSLSSLIENYLVISTLQKEISGQVQVDMPSSIEAFRLFILGYKAFINYDYPSAVKWFLQSAKIDSSYTPTYLWLSISCANQHSYKQAEEWALKVYKRKDKLSVEMKIWADWIYAKYAEKSIYGEMKYAKELLELDDKIPLSHWLVALPYFQTGQYNSAIPELERILSIYKSWGTKPINGSFYEALIISYHETGKYKEEKELLKRALEDFPDDLRLIRRQIISSLSEKDTIAANQFIDKMIVSYKNLSTSEADIDGDLAGLYLSAGIPEKAEKYYRKAVSLAPDNSGRLDDLAFFLIDNNINVTEGLKLNDKAFRSNPANPWRLEDTKGWGLHKLGKDKQALQILQKCWDARPDYQHRVFLHLEEVKKAVTGQK